MVSNAFDMFIDRIDSLGIRDRYELITRQHGVTLGEIFADDRRNSVVLARRKCMRVLREEMAKSDVEIGEIFNRPSEAVMRFLRENSDVRYGRQANGVKTLAPLRPMPEMAEAHMSMLVTLAREFEETSEKVKAKDPMLSEYMRGQAEGVRKSIKVLFPLQPKPSP